MTPSKMSSCQHSGSRSPAGWFLYAGSRFHLYDVIGELLQKLVLDGIESPPAIMMYLSSHELTVFQLTEFTPDGKPRQQDAFGPPCHHVGVVVIYRLKLERLNLERPNLERLNPEWTEPRMD